MDKFQLKNNSRAKGFTLVEIIVSMGIFAIVAVVAAGAFLKIVDANRKSQSLKTAINNLTFVTEAMSREMRTGKDYELIGDDTVRFKTGKKKNDNPNGCELYISYSYDSSDDTILKSAGCFSDLSDYYPIVSQDLTIDELTFTLTSGTDIQPMLQIFIKGYSGIRQQDKSYFTVQTTVSQRIMKL